MFICLFFTVGTSFDCDDPRWEDFIKTAIRKEIPLIADGTSCVGHEPQNKYRTNFLHEIIKRVSKI